MDQGMTLQEIAETFESEWVLVEDPELTVKYEVIKGRVIYHCTDRDELYRKMGELKPKHSAILYTGSVPEDLVILL